MQYSANYKDLRCRKPFHYLALVMSSASRLSEKSDEAASTAQFHTFANEYHADPAANAALQQAPYLISMVRPFLNAAAIGDRS